MWPFGYRFKYNIGDVVSLNNWVLTADRKKKHALGNIDKVICYGLIVYRFAKRSEQGRGLGAGYHVRLIEDGSTREFAAPDVYPANEKVYLEIRHKITNPDLIKQVKESLETARVLDNL